MTPVLKVATASVPFAGTSTTQVFVLLGFPVEHSLSPRMQGAAIEALGLDAVYIACAIAPADLAVAVDDLRAAAERGIVAGANITIPHKIAVVDCIDGQDSIASLTGAVNTILVRPAERGAGRQLWGTNTDVTGLVATLGEIDTTLTGATVIILGSGGMARAAVAACLLEGANTLRVYARDPTRAQDMLDAITSRWHGRLPHLACGPLEAATPALADADVLVQATSIGLAPSAASGLDSHARASDIASAPAVAPEIHLDWRLATSNLSVLDAVYGRGGTRFLRAAEQRGLRTAHGEALLLHQGAAALTLWTGRPAPLTAMRAALTM